MVLMPEIWSELTYGYVGTLYASLGQRWVWVQKNTHTHIG